MFQFVYAARELDLLAGGVAAMTLAFFALDPCEQRLVALDC